MSALAVVEVQPCAHRRDEVNDHLPGLLGAQCFGLYASPELLHGYVVEAAHDAVRGWGEVPGPNVLAEIVGSEVSSVVRLPDLCNLALRVSLSMNDCPVRRRHVVNG